MFLITGSFCKRTWVSFSSINRWEGGKSKPNMSAMKKIKEFCETQNIDFSVLEEQWTENNVEDK